MSLQYDFMSLLKNYNLICPEWVTLIPNPNGNLVRFINEIVAEEESDRLVAMERKLILAIFKFI